MTHNSSGVHTGALPGALIVGPYKCGTTWIHQYLEARGDVCLPYQVKETYFFDCYHDRGLNWYRARFSMHDATIHTQTVEVAPSLFHVSIDLPKIIRADLGDIPIIITLRDPVARAWSHYQHARRGDTRDSLKTAAAKIPEILEPSRYEKHLPRWMDVFTSVTVLQQEELRIDPGDYTRKLCEALGLRWQNPHSMVLARANEATAPPSFLLARLARKSARKLRQLGYYNMVHKMKQTGLKKVIFGPPKLARPPNPEELGFLHDSLIPARIIWDKMD